MTQTDTDKRFCRILFDVMEGKGVRDVVCSPGSRNAPLLIAAASRENMRKHVAVDERSAAFMALGMASVGRRPVALVCTSGTALLNYGPAIAEAFYQAVPLIVISADRPEQWIDQDDSQTLRQYEAFANYVKKSYQLPALGDDDGEMLWYANRIANDAMIEATSRRQGPVHINVRLSDPLGRKTAKSHEPQRMIDFVGADGIADKESIRRMAAEVAGARVMLVAGFMPPDARLHRAVAELCSLPNVAAMTETLSNLHVEERATAVDSVLTAYSAERLDAEAPDLVISIGGSLVSRKLKEYLRRNSGKCRHWQVGWNHTTSDCFMSLTRRIEVAPARFLHQLAAAAKKIPQESQAAGYREVWDALRTDALQAKERFVAEAPWSELRAFRQILDSVPPSANLFLSNGTSVRYAQILSRRAPHASYCNRGVSGIDGSASTAIGGSKAYKGPTLLLTGDMSMAYDVGSLALPDIPGRMKIIVVDNSGGGIFRFIPTTSTLEEREEYFCAPPRLPLRQLADGYGWDYLEATGPESLGEALRQLHASPRRCILRVECPPEESARLLRQYMNIKTDNQQNI